MKTVRPKPLVLPVTNMALSPEEGFVLSRIDGKISVDDLVALTGIDESRVGQIVAKLATQGAIELEAIDAPSGALPDVGSGPAVDVPYAADRVVRATSPPAEEDESDESLAHADDSDPDVVANERNYRQVYEVRFRSLPTDARVQAAKTASAADLFALCCDAEPSVVAALLENPALTIAHVRVVALHHHTATGLELLSRRREHFGDAIVERRLLCNLQCSDTVLSRILGSKRVFQTYKVAIDRDVSEHTRVSSRGILRQKFQSATPEERADFVVRTEGRCLILMTGCTFDAKTTAILCKRPYNSVLFIQNFAKFSATPPALLAHLIKQPFVRNSLPLKKLLLQHPNIPGDVKRQF